MAYNPFYWWRRKTKRTLLKRKDAFKGKSFLLQQIEHGDYEYSDYNKQAQEELPIAHERIEKLKLKHKGGEESLKEESEKILRMAHVRINRLKQDHHEEENRMLGMLRDSLLKEFKIDLWDKALEEVGEGDLKDLYYTYELLAKQYGKGKLRSRAKVTS